MRYTDSVCKLCRREGQKLFLKGSRCYSDKCSVARRSYAPGQHGQGRKKSTEYGLQLRAKQKARRFYGIGEKQFLRYFEIGERKAGITGENLLRMLESRLDNIIYRLGWAASRAQARQLVTHNFFAVNGRKVNIPSFLVRDGDVVSVRPNRRDRESLKAIIEAGSSRPIPKWLDLNRETLEAKVLSLPTREEIDAPVDEQLIVEFYSR